MNINAIASSPNSIQSISPKLAPSKSGSFGSSESFGSTLQGVIESLDKQQTGVEREIARTVAGEGPDLHRTIAAMQTADLSFQLALQVRNKLIGAYEEVMRMQV